jgi:hypothetical protein
LTFCTRLYSNNRFPHCGTGNYYTYTAITE